MLPKEQLNTLPIDRLGTALSDADRLELEIASEMFGQADLIPSLMAQARGHQPVFYTAEMKAIAERMARRVAANSPNAVRVADFLLSRGFEGYLEGRDTDSLAAFELDHFLVPVFEHPDARIGIGALLEGKFPDFKRRYPF